MTTRGNTSGHERGIFLSWTVGNARTADLADRLDLEPVFVCVGKQRAATAPLRWAAQAALSMPALLRRDLPVIVLMMPPYPALVLCRAVARARKLPLVIDSHSATFEDSRWQRFLPSTLKMLKQCDLTIVTNSEHRRVLEQHGIAVAELHDPPAPITPVEAPSADGHVLIPASWHVDEPLVEITEAAAQLPDVKFVITGKPSDGVLERIGALPSNVRLSGFVPDADYQQLLADSSMVCCITLNDNTMQRGGYEALATGLPLVTSDYGLLRDYFEDAAEYADPRVDSIVSAIQKVRRDHAGFAARMTQRRIAIEQGYEDSIAPIRAVLNR